GIVGQFGVPLGKAAMHSAHAARTLFPEDLKDFQFSCRRRWQLVHGPASITEELKPKSLGIKRPILSNVKRCFVIFLAHLANADWRDRVRTSGRANRSRWSLLG